MQKSSNSNELSSSSYSNTERRNQRRKWVIRTGCLLAAGTVTMGALGGHKYEWSARTTSLYHTAINYSFFNSVGVILSAFITESLVPPGLFIGGILGFSVPIWLKAFTQSRALYMLLPFGGVMLILGWVAAAFL